MNNKNSYWIQREKEWQAKNLRNDKQHLAQVERLYNQLQNDIENTIKDFYMGYAKYADISMDEAVQRVSQFDINKFEKVAKIMVENKDFSKYANDRLKLYNATMKINRLEYLKAMIGLKLIDTTHKHEQMLNDYLETSYMQACRDQAGILGESLEPSLLKNVNTIVNASFRGATWSQRLWINQDTLKAELDILLGKVMVRGINPAQISNTLFPHINGKVKNASKVAKRLAVTETARVQDVAQMESIKKAGYEYCHWIAEPTACSVCTNIGHQNNGYGEGVYKLDDVPMIPEHPNCRCAKAPYWVDKLTRESGAILKRSKHIANFEAMYEDEIKAKNMYLEIIQRKRQPIIAKIAEAGNMTKKDAKKIYNHVFINKHLTENAVTGKQEMRYFDPDLDIANAFLRIINGQKLKECDIVLLKHELYECNLMEKNPNLVYEKAHKETNKLYNYEELIKGAKNNDGRD